MSPAKKEEGHHGGDDQDTRDEQGPRAAAGLTALGLGHGELRLGCRHGNGRRAERYGDFVLLRSLGPLQLDRLTRRRRRLLLHLSDVLQRPDGRHLLVLG